MSPMDTFETQNDQEKIIAIADSGSPVSFLNEHVVEKLKQTVKGAIWKPTPEEDAEHNLARYNEVFTEAVGGVIKPIEFGG